jgi:hypothetical protein
MRFRAILVLPAFILAFSTCSVFAQPLSRVAADKAVPANESVSGKIASVGDAEFTVAVANDKDKRGPQNVEFFVDDKTRVEGKLTVGAEALVEYRSDNGTNIAVHVVITRAASGANVSGAVFIRVI